MHGDTQTPVLPRSVFVPLFDRILLLLNESALTTQHRLLLSSRRLRKKSPYSRLYSRAEPYSTMRKCCVWQFRSLFHPLWSRPYFKPIKMVYPSRLKPLKVLFNVPSRYLFTIGLFWHAIVVEVSVPWEGSNNESTDH